MTPCLAPWIGALGAIAMFAVTTRAAAQTKPTEEVHDVGVPREATIVSGSRDVGEAVTMERAETLATAGGLELEGFGPRGVLLVEDGERIVGTLGGYSRFGLPIVDHDRMQVSFGPLVGRWGSGAMGGVIDLTDRPPVIEGWSGTTRLEGRYPFGALVTRAIHLREGDKWATFDAWVDAANAVDLGDDNETDRVAPTKRQHFAFRSGMQVTPNLYAEARFRYGRDKSSAGEEPRPGELIDVPADSHRMSARLRGELALGRDHRLELATGAQWFIGSLERNLRHSPDRETFSEIRSLRSIDARGTFFLRSPAQVTITARAETEGVDQTHRVASEIPGAGRPGVDREDAITTGSVDAEVRWAPVKAFQALLGSRFEASSRYGAMIAPRASIRVDADAAFSLRVDGGRVFGAAGPGEIVEHRDPAEIDRVLQSERLAYDSAWGIRGSATARIGEIAAITGTGFASWFDQYSVLRELDEWHWVRVESDAQLPRIAGAEAALALTPDRLRIGATYRFTHSDGDLGPNPGIDTARAIMPAPHTVLASIVGDLPHGMTVAARWRFVAPAAAPDEETETPSYSVVDLRYGKELWRGSELYGGVLNVLDAVREAARPGDIRPAEGRTFFLGLRLWYPFVGPKSGAGATAKQ